MVLIGTCLHLLGIHQSIRSNMDIEYISRIIVTIFPYFAMFKVIWLLIDIRDRL